MSDGKQQQIILPSGEEIDDALGEKLEDAMNGVEALKETIPEQQECCGNCKFFLDSASIAQKGKQGFCRRYPPTVFILGMQQAIVGQKPSTVTQSNFPPMAINGWCGDFTPRLVQ